MAFLKDMRLLVAVLVSALFSSSLGAYQLVELKGGAAVRGGVVVEHKDSIFIDLGFDVIEVPKAAVTEIRDFNDNDGVIDGPIGASELYRLDPVSEERSIRHWADELGEAVTLVQTPTGLGSGFVIHEDGYIVTNNHVIAGEHRISVTIFKRSELELQKENYENVRIVATSADLDLALLKIDVDLEDSPSFDTVSLAFEDGALREGQTVFAIGSPLGLDRTVSEGIISVANRVIGGRLYLQTTTQINPGNSGGPLFNLRGEVVGVNNMKIAAVGAEGLGFAISSRILKSFLDNLDAYAFDPRNPNSGFRYLTPPSMNPSD